MLPVTKPPWKSYGKHTFVIHEDFLWGNPGRYITLSRNWAAWDILAQPKPAPTGRQLGNEKQYKLLLSHFKQYQVLLVKWSVSNKKAVGKKKFPIFFSVFCFSFLSGFIGALTAQLGTKCKQRKKKKKQHKVCYWTIEPLEPTVFSVLIGTDLANVKKQLHRCSSFILMRLPCRMYLSFIQCNTNCHLTY